MLEKISYIGNFILIVIGIYNLFNAEQISVKRKGKISAKKIRIFSILGLVFSLFWLGIQFFKVKHSQTQSESETKPKTYAESIAFLKNKLAKYPVEFQNHEMTNVCTDELVLGLKNARPELTEEVLQLTSRGICACIYKAITESPHEEEFRKKMNEQLGFSESLAQFPDLEKQIGTSCQ